MKRLLGLVLIAFATIVATSPAGADSYPSRPIRMIVPAGPGSGADIIGRIIADRLSEQMKVSVIVENRDGAGTSIGASFVAKSAPDGYTLLLAPTTLTVISGMMVEPSYDPIRDFAAVAKIAVQPMVAVTPPDAPYKTLTEFIAYAKANPGTVMYATSGKGTPSHLEVELLRQRYGLNIQDVPYKSFGQAITDTMNGLVGIYFPTLPAAMPHIKSGKVRALAVGSVEPSVQAPQLPTISQELGLPDYEVSAWYGVVAPAGTPADIIARLDAEITTALRNPTAREQITKTGAIIAAADSAKFGEMIRSDTIKWHKLIKELGLKVSN